MTEIAGLAAKITYWGEKTTQAGHGLSCCRIVDALRAYLQDTSVTHYWQVDTDVVGGGYNLTTNLAPYNGGTTRFCTLVLKPLNTTGGGADQQRIVYVAWGVTTVTGTNGVLWVGYLPEGTFSGTEGVNLENVNLANPTLVSEPAAWSGLRQITGTNVNPVNNQESFFFVEYRDSPTIVSDPGQSALLALNASQSVVDVVGGSVFSWLVNWNEENMFYCALAGRVIAPLTAYHEIAIGNKGDGVFTGVPNRYTNNTTVNQFETGNSGTGFLDNSSIVRTGPTQWSFAGYNGESTGQTVNSLIGDASFRYVGGSRELLPLFVWGKDTYKPSYVANNHSGYYGIMKYMRAGVAVNSGWDGSVIGSDTPSSQQAWRKIRQYSNEVGRVFLWNKTTVEKTYLQGP